MELRKRGLRPCNCVLRAIFRVCFNRYRFLCDSEYSSLKLREEHGVSYSRPNEEFMADFYLVAMRSLKPRQWALFRLHFVGGKEWSECCAKLAMDRGNFFHEVYRIEERLGRVFCELRPYPLFPLWSYYARGAEA